ncbi:MAG TPA: alpha/beta hydrolase [Solimonas sp.]|nr:alpha/beta hydrolase [Solimonas sp.]
MSAVLDMHSRNLRTVPVFQREDVAFQSQGTTCRAWLYRPARSATTRTACIVMAHGLGGTRAAGLEPFAERFAANGHAVLLFDYRHFGASDGAPRQLLTVGRQLDDWRAAIRHARTLPGVDPARVALWGTSLSSGHVLTIGAEDSGVAAISAQNPMTDGLATVLHLIRNAGLWHLCKLAALGLVDQLRALLGLSPLLLPIVGRVGQTATLNAAGAYEKYLAIADASWRNQMSARLALTLGLYRPSTKAQRLRCPVLIQACMEDTVVSAPAAVALARRIPRAELKQYACMDHFSIYAGNDFERAVGDQLRFFHKTIA